MGLLVRKRLKSQGKGPNICCDNKWTDDLKLVEARSKIVCLCMPVVLHVRCSLKTKAQSPCLFTQHFTPIKRWLWSVRYTAEPLNVLQLTRSCAHHVHISPEPVFSHLWQTLNEWNLHNHCSRTASLYPHIYVINATHFFSSLNFWLGSRCRLIDVQHLIYHQSFGMTNDKFMLNVNSFRIRQNCICHPIEDSSQ